jgi:hypothetical protein
MPSIRGIHFRVPQMPLACKVWRNGNATSNPPDLNNVSCALHFADKGNVVYLGTAGVGMLLYVPRFTDLRGSIETAGSPDTVEVPGGTGNFYTIVEVCDAFKGFGNEYRVALLQKVAPWTFPLR